MMYVGQERMKYYVLQLSFAKLEQAGRLAASEFLGKAFQRQIVFHRGGPVCED
jgi:hypothetical protein